MLAENEEAHSSYWCAPSLGSFIRILQLLYLLTCQTPCQSPSSVFKAFCQLLIPPTSQENDGVLSSNVQFSFRSDLGRTSDLTEQCSFSSS